MTAGGQGLPVVAVVGRPNVGKSSLVNRILGRREAIVEETPGVTRDRRSFVASWAGRSFEVVDTGGLEPGQQGLDAQVAEQAHLAVETADLVVHVVDAAAGILEDDLVVAAILRRASKPVIVAVNKVDDPRDRAGAATFYRLGLGDPLPVSALHGNGSGDLLDALVEALGDDEGDAPPDAWASIAIVGRPNVGKSSLLNVLVGDRRSIVDAAPGTTRDPVDSFIDHDSHRIRIVDTAGMRRRTHIDDPIEYFSYLRSRRTLERVDAAVLLIDGSEGVTAPDQKIAEAIVEAGRACVVAINKWDLVPKDETDRKRFDGDIATKLRFLPWATVLRLSALTRRGVEKVLPAVAGAIESHRARIPTATLNRVVHDTQQDRPHPRTHGRAIRVLYAAQVDVGPPRIVLFSSGVLEDGYLRFLERSIRATFPFHGSPLVLEQRLRRR